jgi:predicted PurR-regulated permease PerM
MATTLLGDYDRSRIPLWVGAVVLIFALSFIIWKYIGTFILGLFVYYITRPIHRQLYTVLRNRSLTALVSLLAVAVPVILLIGYTFYVGAIQLASFAESADLQPVLDALQPYIGNLSGTSASSTDPQAVLSSLLNDPQQFLSGGAVDAANQAVTPALGYLSAFGNGLIQLFVVLALAFYLLRDDHKLATWFRRELAGEGSPVHAYLKEVDHNLMTIYFGNILNAFAAAILAVAFYNGLNVFSPAGVAVPAPTLLGILTGVGSLIPVVGMKIVYIPIALLLTVETLIQNPALIWFPVVFAVVSFVIIDTIPDLILRPYVSGRDLHTGAVMIAYIIGPLLFGWYGLFLGPLILVLVIHFARILLPELVRGEPVTASATAGNPLDPNDNVPSPEPADPDEDETSE